ncbi:TPA: macrolide ABC transporter ATP-binding protein [Candidatus Collierbacteria bacterium]|uniref:Macrolide ABC transporter ATP-binding protein n=2 Tax=Candidatus Collieribacteriota TaxID=1752725 RepID=A0A1F5FXZ7_9BACT|nr:MAG: ABC transporter related protein [Microgenomates group bacterium GW2011_GWF1_46_12]KKU27640.1 MAG: ABC transporter related protein [Microgenomates group bacterium GW2011_GWF2_46_18]KKU43413.1 MAG: ABC transporter related protein [Microgenomates group bacterium GW2011_GWA1_46_7]KKU61050.1 MAG: ABC transporter related protein [Microgenomates group bacterium GW2011_GWE1_47_12]KKU62480.1 MAG: ABC transporter related protein [Microgenomates group bacterium GW2011_GWD1_47_13]OGD71005.1 MAG: m
MSTKKNKTSPDSVLSLFHVSKDYQLGDETLRVLDDVSLEIKSGELVAIIGPSGSGKSTLMHIMGLLDRQSKGTVTLAGRDVSDLSEAEAARLRNHYVGFIFQQFNLLPRTSSVENVLLPTIYNGGDAKLLQQKAIKILSELGLDQRLGNYPNQLSGGQQQRVAIARALINDPAVIFADEPTGNLDSKSGHEVVEILKNLNKQGRTIVIVTHDPELAKMAHRIIHIFDGRIKSDKRKKL